MLIIPRVGSHALDEYIASGERNRLHFHIYSFSTYVLCKGKFQLSKISNFPISKYFNRNEHHFLLAGLKVPRHADWAARQAAYLAAVKEFLLKLNPDFTSIEVTFVKALNIGRKEDKRLFLSVDCKDVQQ